MGGFVVNNNKCNLFPISFLSFPFLLIPSLAWPSVFPLPAPLPLSLPTSGFLPSGFLVATREASGMAWRTAA